MKMTNEDDSHLTCSTCDYGFSTHTPDYVNQVKRMVCRLGPVHVKITDKHVCSKHSYLEHVREQGLAERGT